MTKNNLIVAVVVCVFLYWVINGVSDLLTPDVQVNGLYLESTGGMIPTYGVSFLDDRHVKLFSNGQQLGPMCTYVVHGNHVDVTHACGVWHFVKKGDDYNNNDLFGGWPFRVKSDKSEAK